MKKSVANFEQFVCPVEATVALIGGKWKTVILWNLKDGKVRFNKLMAEIPEISPKMMTKQLRELERDGLVERKMYPEIPTSRRVQPDPDGLKFGAYPYPDGAVGHGQSRRKVMD